MSEIELLVIAGFVAMGSYISYLRHELNKARMAVGMLTMLITDIADKDVEVERAKDGIRIRIKRPTGEVS